MNKIKGYGKGINPQAVKAVKEINEKIEKTADENELMKLKMQRLMKGLEINGGLMSRPYGALFPF